MGLCLVILAMLYFLLGIVARFLSIYKFCKDLENKDKYTDYKKKLNE